MILLGFAVFLQHGISITFSGSQNIGDCRRGLTRELRLNSGSFSKNNMNFIKLGLFIARINYQELYYIIHLVSLTLILCAACGDRPCSNLEN